MESHPFQLLQKYLAVIVPILAEIKHGTDQLLFHMLTLQKGK